MKPKILIVGEDGFSGDTGHFVISRLYGGAVSRAGGLPFCAFDVFSAKEYTEQFDGLLLTGGPDIHCSYFGEIYKDRDETPYFSRTRDDLDFALCREFIQKQKPVFGVGRGMLVLNVALGGSLYKDLKRDAFLFHPEKEVFSGFNGKEKAVFAFHTIRVAENARLLSAFHSGEQVNSAHHQGIKQTGDGLVPTVFAPDGVIEGLEHRTLPFFGVMWHPEYAEDGEADLRAFTRFVDLCREKEDVR